MTDNAELTALVARAQSELPYNMSAFEEIARLEYRWVSAFCRSVVMDQSLAANVVQDSLLRAMHNLKQLQEPEKFRSWLSTIVVNMARAQLAKEQREQQKRFLYEEEIKLGGERRNESEYEMTELLAPLSVDDRALVSLKVLNDLDFHEIAEIMQLKESATKMRYYRALEKIRATLPERDPPL